MTRLPVTYTAPPDRREQLAAKVMRLTWSMLCWTAVASLSLLAWALIKR